MFVKNTSIDKIIISMGRWELSSRCLARKFLFISRRGQNDWVEKYEWQNIRYKVDQATKEIEEEVLGTFVHYLSSWLGPLRYIKSRSDFLTKRQSMFRRFYARTSICCLVAFTIIRGLVLLSPLRMNGISNDQDVMDYSLNKASDELLKNSLHFETKIYT
jgi:hypothetical protein